MDWFMNWEYVVREFAVETRDNIFVLEESLNSAGNDGWELVCVATTSTTNLTHLVT